MGSLLGTQVHRTEIDGVPCFWVETGRPTLAAQLVFRHGMTDEDLPRSGWTHLMEHLALHGRGGGALHVNGSVGILETTFAAHGPSEAVVDHLASVTRWLTSPQFDELDRERHVLAAEAAERASASTRALGWRYGAVGPGLASQSEPGLGRATAESLARHAASTLTRGNAALVLDGPPPAGLRLDLPDGELVFPPAATPCDMRLPAAYVDGEVVLSGVVARTDHYWALPGLLERSLTRRLREEAGGAYSPWAHYEPVDRDAALILAGTRVHDRVLPTVVEIVLADLREFGRDGWVDEVLAELRAQREQALLDPYTRAGLARGAASSWMRGQESPDLEEILQQTRELTAAAVHEDLVAFRNTLLLGVPGQARWSGELPMVRQPAPTITAPTASYRHRDWPAEKARLLLDDRAVAIVAPSGDGSEIRLDQVEGLLTFADGSRDVVDRDGWVLRVDPDVWRGAAVVVRALDERIPSQLHLPQPWRERSPGLTLPQRLSRAAAVELGRIRDWGTLNVVALVFLVLSGAAFVKAAGEASSGWTFVGAVLLTRGLVRLIRGARSRRT